MEIESKDGRKILLVDGPDRELGRGFGFDSKDRTVSRRHVSFKLHTSDLEDDTRVCFEAIGKNPIWVYDGRSGEIRVYKRFERGEMESGDMFCFSAKKPIWFTLKKMETGGQNRTEMETAHGFDKELAERLQSSFALREMEELELDSIFDSHVDPVKEFGLIVPGHEYDGYPKNMIRDIRIWDWFLDEHGKDSEDDEVDERKGKKGVRAKRKKGGDDEEWTGESEEDKELITKSRKIKSPKYLTRSNIPIKGENVGKNHLQKTSSTKKIYNEEEDDESLGGFIVDEGDVEEELETDDDEEEEDFDEDDDDEGEVMK